MPPLRVGHLVSGGGTTMEHVAREMLDGKLGDIVPALVIADRPCAALEKATALKISNGVLQKADFGNKQEWADTIERVLLEHEVDIVFQNGWVPLTPPNVINRWKDTVYNQHPGPLSGNGKPDFGGKGMCGTAVTAARILYLLETGEEDPKKLTTESTIHMVTSGLDEGHIVRIEPYSLDWAINLCRKNGITSTETAVSQASQFDVFVKSAQGELLNAEHVNVGKVLSDRAKGHRTRIDKDERATNINTDILTRVKAAAIKMYPTK